MKQFAKEYKTAGALKNRLESILISRYSHTDWRYYRLLEMYELMAINEDNTSRLQALQAFNRRYNIF